MIIGAAALGVLLAVAALQWQERTFPESSYVPSAQAAPEKAGSQPAAKSGALSPAQVQQAVARGKAVFDQKCTACHTIGGGKTVGPDLKGVTAQRDRAWLVEFVSNPDAVFARNDPIAVKLKAEFGGVAMPNLGVTPAQADDVLRYIESK
jgi:protein SCO1/2